MTHAADLFHPGIRLREWFEARIEAAAVHRKQHSSYARTLRELQRSSDRDLADIGISRLSIKEIAYETAYGHARSQTVIRQA
jgi:uncharacterized protein YjiS (DUF1127 family)